MAEEVTAACGPRGKHDPDRTAGAPRHRARLGDPRRAAGARGPAADAHRGRHGSSAGNRCGSSTWVSMVR